MSTPNGYDYEYLSEDQRREIVEGRLQQYEVEHFGHSLNRRALERAADVSPEEKAQQLERIDKALASLERSIELHRKEREQLSR